MSNSSNMEGWYCQQECRQVRMPSRMPEPMDDTPEDEDDSSSHVSSSPDLSGPPQTLCRSPGCRRHNPVSGSKGESIRGNSLRSNNTMGQQDWQPPHSSRSPRKCYSAIDIEANNSRFGSAPNLERYHDWCTECIESSQHQRRKAAGASNPTVLPPNGKAHQTPCVSPSSFRRTMEHLPKSSHIEPFYPSKSPFRKKFKAEKRRQFQSYYLLCVWVIVIMVALILYFVLLGETVRQRNMVHELSQIVAKLNVSSLST